MYEKFLVKMMGVFMALSLVFLGGCDLGLDFQAASSYCKAQYMTAGEQIERLESSELIQSHFQKDTNDLITEPLKMCYMAGFICNLKCYNLEAGCHESFYEAHKYCSTTPSISKSIR